jgi:hypothetical protein
MQISLTPSDVNEALVALLQTRGLPVTKDTVSFAFKNRRTKGGIFAEVTVGAPEAPVAVPAPVAVAEVTPETVIVP